MLADVPGISEVLLEGCVTYSNEAKARLGVKSGLIKRFGAVSERVAAEMADAVRKRAGSKFGVSVTGIAGPGGGTDKKPVGLVYISLASAECIKVKKFNFSGDRAEVRCQSVIEMMKLLEEGIDDKVIKLWETGTPFYDETFSQAEPTLTPYIVEGGKKNAAVIVCPGGGYSHRAYHEGEPVAKWLNTLGISAFVLNYRYAPYTYKAIENDIYRAVRVIRYNAERFGIDKEKVATLGFSAGGHLSSCAALYFDRAILDENDPVDKENSKVNAAVLCYPVISFCEEFGHERSANNFLGEFKTPELVKAYSGEFHVKEDTPPIFMWHNADDNNVSAANCFRLGEVLSKNNVPYEIHVFPRGGHGVGLAEDSERTSQWTRECALWFKSLGFIK